MLKKLTGCSIIFLFIFGVWCATLATAGSPTLAAQRSGLHPGCTRARLALEKMDCDQLTFMCSFGFVPGSFSEVALASSRTHDFSKDAHFLALEVVPGISSDEISLAANGLIAASLTYPAQKVPIYLFNSVLTL